MKRISTFALAAAIALGGFAGVVPQTAALAAPKKAKITPSSGINAALAKIQKAQADKNLEAASAALAEARAAMSTDDDKYIVGSSTYDIARQKQDNVGQAEGIDLMLQSGKVEAAQIPSFNLALGQLSYGNGNYAKAEEALARAIQLSPEKTEAYALLANARAKNNNPSGAVAAMLDASAQSAKTGQKIPSEWYGFAVSNAYNAKLAGPQTEQLLSSWLKDYPSPTNWRDALVIYRDLNGAKLDKEATLDLFRLQRAAKGLKGERDYAEYVETVYIRYPGEAVAVTDEGVAAGQVNLGTSRGLKEMYDIAKGKISADKASLSKASTNAKVAIGNADAYASYGDYVAADELYTTALTKPGVDINTVRLRKGANLFNAGKLPEAKQEFAGVAGPVAGLAKFWTILVDNRLAPPPAAAPAPAAPAQ